jgi:hypothetical protein
MKTAIRWGALLVIAATSAAPLADEGLMMERYPDGEVEASDPSHAGAAADAPRPDRVVVPLAKATSGNVVEAGTGSAAPADSEDVKASFEERWLREREGYRDGGY